MYHWATQYSDETQKMRFDMEMNAPLGDEDVGGDDIAFDKALEGMMG